MAVVQRSYRTSPISHFGFGWILAVLVLIAWVLVALGVITEGPKFVELSFIGLALAILL